MTATREELEKRTRLIEEARLLNLDANPSHDSSVVNKSSTAALEQIQQTEIKQDLSSYAKAHDTIKEILLPIPSRAGKTDLDDLQENSTLIDNLTHELQDMCLSYEEEKNDDNKNTNLSNEKLRYHRTSFFSKHLALEFHQAGMAILKADEISVANVIALVKKYPSLLSLPCKVQDPYGRWVQGTLLQIAAMANDVNLRRKKEKEKDHGLVELLAEAGGLSQEEVAKQISDVLLTEEAKRENQKRNQRILSALVEFAENIINIDLPTSWNTEAEFKEAQAKIQPYIDAFRDALLPDPNEVITCGYIFDLQILVSAAKWFEDKINLDRFDDWWSLKSDLFWVNGFGSLQGATTACDAQVIRKGVGRVVDNKELPERVLKNPDGASFFFNASSRLGLDFYLGYYGYHSVEGHPLRAGGSGAPCWKKLCQAKTGSLQRIIQRLDSRTKARCIIM